MDENKERNSISRDGIWGLGYDEGFRKGYYEGYDKGYADCVKDEDVKEYGSDSRISDLEESDVWSLDYAQGYRNGYDKGYDDGAEGSEENKELVYPNEICIDATDFNYIENTKDELQLIICKLFNTPAPYESIMQLYDIMHRLTTLEKSLAGSRIVDYYKLFRPIVEE